MKNLDSTCSSVCQSFYALFSLNIYVYFPLHSAFVDFYNTIDCEKAATMHGEACMGNTICLDWEKPRNKRKRG